MENSEALFALEQDFQREVGDQPWNIDNFLVELPLKWKLSHVALMDERIVGYIICSLRDEAIYGHKLMVDKHARGKGIARSLWRHCLQVGMDEKIEKVMVRIRVENRRSLEFHDRLGFKMRDEIDRTRPDGSYYVVDTRIREVIKNFD